MWQSPETNKNIIHKCLDIEQYTIRWWVDHWRNNKKQNEEFLESNENENTPYPNLWETMTETFIAAAAYSDISEGCPMTANSAPLALEKQEEANLRIRKWKEIT